MMLVLLVAAQLAMAPPVSAATVSVSAPQVWWQTAGRDATLRLIGVEPPAGPRRYRFQCVGARWPMVGRSKGLSRSTKQRCIDADAGIAADLDAFQARAAAEAVRPIATADQRLSRAAWLRAMTLDAPPLDTGDAVRSYLVEETIAPGDLLPPEPAPEPSGELAFTVPPRVDYPPALLREGVSGLVRLACRSDGDRLSCRTMTIDPASTIVQPDGSLEPSVRGYLMLIEAAHRAMQSARFAAITRTGRPSVGLTFQVPINFRLEED